MGPLYTLGLAYRGAGQLAEFERIGEQINRMRGGQSTTPGPDVDEGIPQDE
jgi:hypothetical protein